MPLPKAYLATKLTKQLHTTDNGSITSIEGAYRYMTVMPKERQLRQAWQRACHLILEQADSAAVTHQVQRALFLDYRLDLKRTRGGTSP
jgi:hypothetical protein